MIWQDAVLTAGSLVFIAALIPMVRAAAKPPLSTSIPTGLVLLAFVPAEWTLGAVYAACTSAISGALWLTLAVQRVRAESAGAFNPTSGGI